MAKSLGFVFSREFGKRLKWEDGRLAQLFGLANRTNSDNVRAALLESEEVTPQMAEKFSRQMHNVQYVRLRNPNDGNDRGKFSRFSYEGQDAQGRTKYKVHSIPVPHFYR